MRDLVEWIQDNGCNKEEYIDYRNGLIFDSWGSTIVLLTEKGQLVGVGSAGPNRRWDQGESDDICVYLSDIRKEYYGDP